MSRAGRLQFVRDCIGVGELSQDIVLKCKQTFKCSTATAYRYIHIVLNNLEVEEQLSTKAQKRNVLRLQLQTAYKLSVKSKNYAHSAMIADRLAKLDNLNEKDPPTYNWKEESIKFGNNVQLIEQELKSLNGDVGKLPTSDVVEITKSEITKSEITKSEITKSEITKSEIACQVKST